MRKVTRGAQNSEAIAELSVQPDTELDEAMERPAADAEEDTALVRHRSRQRVQGNHDTVIELGLLRPYQRESGALAVGDESGRERHVDLRHHLDVGRPKACQVPPGIGTA